MPIYEFYCEDCHTVFNFFSRSVNTAKVPDCPLCNKKGIKRLMSMFSVSKNTGETESGDMPFDEAKMTRAMEVLAKEAGHVDENDPRQSVQLLRKLSDMTGVGLGPGMEE